MTAAANPVDQVVARTRKLREMAATGYSNAEIGETFGVHPRTVQRWRAMAQIPSSWSPATATLIHGTPTGYRHHGCLCAPCKAACKADTAARRARYQRESARHAVRHLDPWTPADDAVALTRPPLEAARLLGRTYDAVRARRQRLLLIRSLTSPAARTSTGGPATR